MEKYDLILIGTGFASSFFLKKYLEKNTAQKKILVLERGRLLPYSERLNIERGTKPDYYDALEAHENTYINTNESKPWVFDVNFGGSSNCWWACTPRFMPNDFKLNSLYGRGQDWPLTYDQLEAYYCEAEEIMGISGPDDTPYPKSKKYPLPSHILSSVDLKMQEAYGSFWGSQPTGRASKPFGTRNACCTNYACSTCPINAKFTIENTLKYLYEDPRVELSYGSQAFKLEIVNNVVKGVYFTPTSNPDLNNPVYVEGEVVALGTNALFNAHILLNSGDTNNLTGAGLSDQRGFFANMYLGMDNLGGSSALTANGYMQYDGDFRKESASCLVENHNGPFIRNERGKWRKMARFKFVFEELPENSNRVKLSDNVLKPLIEYTEKSDYIKNGRKRVLSQLENIFKPLPVEEVFVDDFYQETEFHVLSTVRMGTNDTNSVVDRNQVHHKYRNLFVLGGSSFPTVSAANPSLTISALSLMAADASF